MRKYIFFFFSYTFRWYFSCAGRKGRTLLTYMIYTENQDYRVLFYKDSSGAHPVLAYIESLPEKERKNITTLSSITRKYMSKKTMQKDTFDFQAYVAHKLKSPTFRKYYDMHGKQLEIAYLILQLRKKSKVSQAKLARKIGTTQSNIARMERGEQNLTTETLQKVATAFNRELKIEFVK